MAGTYLYHTNKLADTLITCSYVTQIYATIICNQPIRTYGRNKTIFNDEITKYINKSDKHFVCVAPKIILGKPKELHIAHSYGKRYFTDMDRSNVQCMCNWRGMSQRADGDLGSYLPDAGKVWAMKQRERGDGR